MPRLTVCEQARVDANAHGDPVAAQLIDMLKRQIAQHEQREIEERARELTRLFRSLDSGRAATLRLRLNDPGDALGRFFDCELDHRLRRRLRKLLDVAPSPPQGITRSPGPVVPGPSDRATLDKATADKQTDQKEKPKPRVKVKILDGRRRKRRGPPKELLDHARRVLEALVAAGVTGGVVALLGVALAEAGKAWAEMQLLGVVQYLVFDAATGRLAFDVPDGIDYGELRRISRASSSPDFARLERALQEVQRLDDQAIERLEQRLAETAPPETTVPAPQPPAGEPPAPGDAREPRPRKTVTGFHGANGDHILGILRSRTMRPRRGMVWLNVGDHRESYQHGGDRKRRANFVAEIQLTFDPQSVVEERRPTQGVRLTLVLHTSEPLEAAVTRLFRRRRDEDGDILEDVVSGAAAIEAALR